MYPADFVMGVLFIPLGAFLVEALFWLGLFDASGSETIGGYTSPHYVAYLLWLVTGIGMANWRYERVMISEINTGGVNTLLLRPSSFYEYHLGQQLGQKFISAVLTVPILIGIVLIWDLPFHLNRLIPALMMGFSYVAVMFSLHFAVISMSFFYDHVYSLNNTKNMTIWFLTGELFPLDLLPSPMREWVIQLPFSCGTYLPAAYLTGRISTETFLHGFVSLGIGAVIFGLIARFVWRKGLRSYSGTGA